MRRSIVTIIIFCCTISLWAAIPVEREQQFTYYWYAAHQALDRGQYDRAFMLLRFCEQIDPKDGKTKEFLGLIYEALGQKEKAMECYEAAYTHEPTLWEHYIESLLRTNTQDAKTHKKNAKKAVKIAEKAVKNDPEDENSWDRLRQVYTANQQYRKALSAQNHIDQIIGYNAYSAINRYRIYVLWQKPKLALKAIDDYLETDPTNLRFLLFRVELLEYTRTRPDLLVQTYQQILILDPNNILVLNNYAYYIAVHGGDLKEAERMSQRTIQAEPDNATYLDTYAWILHLQGQDMLAAFYIRKAMENADKNSIQEIKQHYEAIIH